MRAPHFRRSSIKSPRLLGALSTFGAGRDREVMRAGSLALAISILAFIVSFAARDWVATAAPATQDETCDATADYFLGVENYSRAVELHRSLIAAYPDKALAHYHLGFAYGMLGMRNKELAEYRRAAALGLKQWDLFLNLGRVYLEEGDTAAAIEALTSAVSLGPGHPESHYNLGLAYERRGMLAQARHELTESLRLNPGQPDALNMMAVIDAERGDRTNARKLWSELVRIEPGFAPARANLTILGRIDQAKSSSFDASGPTQPALR